jgi:5'-phosphate synthase pdxT subunit
VKSAGILALQGDFEKHQTILYALRVKSFFVRSKDTLERAECLIIPGGESTTIGMLLERFSLLAPLRERIRGGMPVFATCAGMILLSKKIEGSDQARIGLMDLTVKRNAYGPQVESFETDISVPGLGNAPVRGVFIRAPIITRAGKNVDVLARFE